MDIHGHHEISKVGRALLDHAFSGHALRPSREAFYFGNWLTDFSQFRDEVAFAGVAQSLKANPEILEQISGGVPADQHDEWLTRMIGTTEEPGELFDTIKELLFVAGYFKFCYRKDFDFPSFKNIFNQFFDDEVNQEYNLGRGRYYPHHHMDRWPVDLQYQTNATRNRSRPPDRKDPGLYSYMRDHLEYCAGHLADLDLNFASKVFSSQEDGERLTKQQIEERFAQFGHAIHVVEDFFAHSTFVEHAVRLSGGPDANRGGGSENGKLLLDQAIASFPPLASMIDLSPELMKLVSAARLAEVTMKDGTLYNRRLLLLRDGAYDPDAAWFDNIGRLNETPTDDQGDPVEDPNIVTGYFDLHDTLISFGHALEDFLGATTYSPDYQVRQAVEWIDDPDKALDDARVRENKETTEALEKIRDRRQEVRRRHQRNPDSPAEPFTIEQSEAEAVAGAILPDDVEPEVQQYLGQALRGLTAAVVYKDYVTSTYRAWLMAHQYVKGVKLVGRLLKIVPDALKPFVLAPLRLGKAFLIGAFRIGCHSLIAKDHDTDFLNDKAMECAKGVHWYIVNTLLRWKRREVHVAVCKVPHEGSSAEGSQGLNVIDCNPYIDWTELLEFFLRHPGAAVRSNQPIYVAEVRIHTVERGDSLSRLAETYRDQSIDPGNFSWQLIAEANYGTSVPSEINAILKERELGVPSGDGVNYRWKRGIQVIIPALRKKIWPAYDEAFEKSWFKPVMEEGWQQIKNAGTHGHILCPVSKSDVEETKATGESMAQYWMGLYQVTADHTGAAQRARDPVDGVV